MSSPGRRPTPIHDAEDPRLEAYRALRDRTQRRCGARFVAESELAVTRLLQSDVRVESLVGTASRLERLEPLAGPDVPLYEVTKPVLAAVMGFEFHRGVAACGLRPDLSAPPAGLLDALAGRERAEVVVAESLGDPANLGALLRNARAFGADLVVLDAAGADPFEPRAIRASMGNVFTLPLVVTTDLPDLVRTLAARLSARVLAATVGPAARPVNALMPPERFVLLVGHEGAGLSEALRATADEEVTVPMAPGADSLNVAAASAVLLFALTRPLRDG